MRVPRDTSPHTPAGSAWDAKITAYNMQLKHETSLCRRRRHHTHTQLHSPAHTYVQPRQPQMRWHVSYGYIPTYIVYQIPHANSIIDWCIVCGMHTITISYIRELSRVPQSTPRMRCDVATMYPLPIYLAKRPTRGRKSRCRCYQVAQGKANRRTSELWKAFHTRMQHRSTDMRLPKWLASQYGQWVNTLEAHPTRFRSSFRFANSDKIEIK